MINKNKSRKTESSEENEYMDVRPEEMEKESFAIITRELHNREIRISYEQAPVVLRCIHTSADFEYAGSLRFSKNVIPLANSALLAGSKIITDTRMGYSGINRAAVKNSGGELHCDMDDLEIAAEARLRGLSRAVRSVWSVPARKSSCCSSKRIRSRSFLRSAMRRQPFWRLMH